jgi:hypothetical protein
MRVLLILFSFSVCIINCNENQAANPAMKPELNYYPNNEDKFSFLVFDTKSVDSFFIKYTQLEPKNQVLTNAFLQLAKIPGAAIDSEMAEKWAKHTDRPDSSDSALAFELLDVKRSNNEQYFIPNLLHLFFYECLPEEFRYKWVQDVSGGFEFNVSFFTLLRTQCKTFNEHIFGSQGFWDENIRKVLDEFVMNEITAQKAKEIKGCINQAEAFNDRRLRADKEHLLEFLDKVIEGKWRLFLYDKN